MTSSDNKLMENSNSVASRETERDEFLFPRSVYKSRFKETSAFAMSDPDHWATYFRSSPRGGNYDRIVKLVNSDRTYKNENINKPPADKKKIPPSKSGCIKSPWIHDEYKKIFYTKSQIPKEIKKNNGAYLYDQLLQYKIGICNVVVEEFLKLEIAEKKIDVYFENDYPCIMVQIKDFSKFFEKEEQKSLYKIVIAHFIAITNNFAYKSNIPVELVNRASFGHNIPNVSETSKSFRISTGIVPKCYAKVLVESLEFLNNYFLVPFLKKDKTIFNLDFVKEEIDNHNEEVLVYIVKKLLTVDKKARKKRVSGVESWKADHSLFDVLCKVGDSCGRKVSYQITRLNKYIDLLANYAHQHFFDSSNSTNDFAQPLRKILKKLTYKDERGVTIKVDRNDYSNSNLAFRDEENRDIVNDQEFWNILQNISSIFEVVDITDLSDAINNKKLKGLYYLLEEANLEFIKSSSSQKSEDGYGSSSDCEVDIDEDTHLYSRKIIVSTGMRAINLAQFLSIYRARTQKVNVDYMYYETAEAVENIVQDINELRSLNLDLSLDVVKYIDLNHCSAKGPNSNVDLKSLANQLGSERVMVLDFTSATSGKISEAIRLFIKKVSVLILVSSGIKNEQVGADMNPYGTLRIIATNSKDLNELYYILRANLISEEKLPHPLHNIRKRYKNAGAVVTSAAIYTADSRYSNYRCNTDDDHNLQDFTEDDCNLPDALKNISHLFSNRYEEYINLTKKHGVYLDTIISWHPDKIEFLGSDDIIDIIDKFDSDDDIFDEIENCYDNDDDLAKGLVNEILSSEEDISDMEFEYLKSKYVEILKDDNLNIDTDGKNIIDIIVRAENESSNEDSNKSDSDASFNFDDYRVGFAMAKRAGLIDSGFSTPRSSSDEETGLIDLYQTEATDSDRSSASSSNDGNSTSSSDDENIMDYE